MKSMFRAAMRRPLSGRRSPDDNGENFPDDSHLLRLFYRRQPVRAVRDAVKLLRETRERASLLPADLLRAGKPALGDRAQLIRERSRSVQKPPDLDLDAVIFRCLPVCRAVPAVLAVRQNNRALAGRQNNAVPVDNYLERA